MVSSFLQPISKKSISTTTHFKKAKFGKVEKEIAIEKATSLDLGNVFSFEPKTAKISLQYSRWKATLDKEYDALMDTCTYILEPYTPYMNIVGINGCIELNTLLMAV